MSTVGKFIVVFKDHVTEEQINKYAEEVGANGGTVTNTYSPEVLRGFAAKIPDEHLTHLQSFTGDIIDYIEPDGVVTTQ